MSERTPINIVRAWVRAANAQDADSLLELSDQDIQIAGPRGEGTGRQLLRDWLARAGLTLETTRAFVRDHTVVLEQRGVWRSPETGEITGERSLASAFRTDAQRVVWFGRYDDLDAAFTATGVGPEDITLSS